MGENSGAQESRARPKVGVVVERRGDARGVFSWCCGGPNGVGDGGCGGSMVQRFAHGPVATLLQT